MNDATMFGMLCALQTAVRAIILTHPHRRALRIALAHEKEADLSALLGKLVPDETIEAFRDTLGTLAEATRD